MQARQALTAVPLIVGLSATLSSQSVPPRPVPVLQPAAGAAVDAPGAAQGGGRPPRTAPVTELDLNQQDADLDGSRISVVFEQPVPIRQVLMLLVRGTRLSLVPSPGPAIEQTLVADLKNVTIRDALNAVLDPLALDFTVRDRLIHVFPRELDTQLFDIDYVASRSTEGAPDLYADLEGGVRALLSEGGRVHVDRAASLLEVTDTPGRLRRVEAYVQAALRRAVRQVALDATAVEVDLSGSPSSSVDWRAVLGRLSSGGAGGSTAGPLSALTLPPGSIEALLRALADEGPTRVLARTRLVATNNQPALVRGDGDRSFSLVVTPQIGSAGLVTMSVHPRVVERVAPAGPGDAQPLLVVREADTFVRVAHGDTVALFGVAQSRETADGTTRKTDVIVLVTPTIIASGVPVADARR